MKKHISTIIISLMIITGLSLLLYPTVSDYLKNLSYRRTIASYTVSAEQLDDESYEEFLMAANAYNERLAQKNGGHLLILSDEELVEYDSLLDIEGTGIMGYVSIPTVNIFLPIYHGTSDDVLQQGVGHVAASSLPVGGPNTHTILSAHTGLPSAKLFTNIDQLTPGDTFSIRVLKEVLTYEVDQILVVLPEETDALGIYPDTDYCTLVTCTPYGVNTHRLLVRGHRIPTPAEAVTDRPTNPVEEALGLNTGHLFGMDAELGLLIVLTVVVLLVAVVVIYFRRRMWGEAKHLKG